MSKVQQLLDQLQNAASRGGIQHLSSFEASPADSYEVSAYEDFLVGQGIDSYTARTTALKAAATPGMAAQLRQAMRASNTGGSAQGLVGMSAQQASGNVLSAANFGITVKRVTADLAVPLPFVLFGQQDSKNGYRQLLGGLLPAGITLTSVDIGEDAGQPDKAVFSYTDGTDTDTVEVTCGTYPYPSLLEASGSDQMRMSKIRLELSDSTKGAQFREDIRTKSNSPFGKNTENSINATAFRRPDQFQNGIVDLDAIFDIDKETSVISKILPVVGFEYTWNSFVEKFIRSNIRGL
jgi:hypothetical protein